MEKKQSLLETIQQHILPQTECLGLFDGKMGVCLYYFIMGRAEKSQRLTTAGEELLSDIINSIRKVKSLSISTGTTGIGLGITYLTKHNYVEGDINEILEDMDKYIYRSLCYAKDPVDGKFYNLPLIDLLTYEIERYKDLPAGWHRELTKEVIILLFNQIYIQRGLDFYHEPLPFSLQNGICIYLWELAEIYQLGIERERICRVLNEMKYFLFAQRPILHANRLAMATVSLLIAKVIDEEDWEDFSQSLKDSVNLDRVLNDEFGEKAILPLDGVIGVALLCERYNCLYGKQQLVIDKEKLRRHVLSSSIWEKFEQDHVFFFTNYSLAGYCGVMLYLKYLEGQSDEI